MCGRDDSKCGCKFSITVLLAVLLAFAVAGTGSTAMAATADAGPDFVGYESLPGAPYEICLDGAGSVDATTFLWEQIGGTPVVLDDPTFVAPCFDAPLWDGSTELTAEEATLIFRLTVDKDTAGEDTDEVQGYVRLPGDANGDDTVNAFDIASVYRRDGGADFNGDGTVNAFDLRALRANNSRRRYIIIKVTHFPSSLTSCPISVSACPQKLTNCPVYVTGCPSFVTQCHASKTLCPQTNTICPKTFTECPVISTICSGASTVCPALPTQCPTANTTCPELATTCPEEATVCPEVDTQCPVFDTQCPQTPADTFCPQVTTICPHLPSLHHHSALRL